MGRLNVLQEYTEPMQTWTAIAATGMSQRLNGAAGARGAVAINSISARRQIHPVPHTSQKNSRVLEEAARTAVPCPTAQQEFRALHSGPALSSEEKALCRILGREKATVWPAV